MSETTSGTDLQGAIFDVAAYLANSAPTSLRETPSLAAYRMVDAAARLIALLHPSNEEQRRFLQQARTAYEEHFNLVMTDQQAFERWLPEFATLHNEETLRRLTDPTEGESAANSSEH